MLKRKDSLCLAFAVMYFFSPTDAKQRDCLTCLHLQPCKAAPAPQPSKGSTGMREPANLRFKSNAPFGQHDDWFIEITWRRTRPLRSFAGQRERDEEICTFCIFSSNLIVLQAPARMLLIVLTTLLDLLDIYFVCQGSNYTVEWRHNIIYQQGIW